MKYSHRNLVNTPEQYFYVNACAVQKYEAALPSGRTSHILFKRSKRPVGGVLAAKRKESYFLPVEYGGKMKKCRRKYENIMNPFCKPRERVLKF